MRRGVVRFACLMVCAAWTITAQEGHPLTGTWAGEWSRSASERTHITLVMKWDGKTITGLINPGPDAIPLRDVSVNWATWEVRLRAEGKSGGKPVQIESEGRVEDIGSAHRRIVGTWTQDGVTGSVTLKRE